MWFKNLKIYRLSPDFVPYGNGLSEQLAYLSFLPCGTLQHESIGWVPPREEHGGYVYWQEYNCLLTLRTEKRVLPPAVVNQATKERARKIEEQQGYKPGRKQMREIKESIIDELLPKAFTQYYDTRVWLDIGNRWFVIDTGSNGVADTVLAAIAKCIDPFPVLPLYVNHSIAGSMTRWLLGDEAPAGFTIDQEAELRSTNENRATVKYVRQSVDVQEAFNHVNAGKQVTRLALTWNDRVSFILTEDLSVKRVTPLDILKENNDPDNHFDLLEDEQFDADFHLMAGELTALLDDLVEAIGGEDAR